MPSEQVALQNTKLENFRNAIDERIKVSQLKANVMRHLTQVRYHLNIAIEWSIGCPEVGNLSEHTIKCMLLSTGRRLGGRGPEGCAF